MSFDHLVLSLFIVSVSFYWLKRRAKRITPSAPAFTYSSLQFLWPRPVFFPTQAKFCDGLTINHWFMFDGHLLDRIQSWNHELKLPNPCSKHGSSWFLSRCVLALQLFARIVMVGIHQDEGMFASPFRYSVLLPLANLHNGNLNILTTCIKPHEDRMG